MRLEIPDRYNAAVTFVDENIRQGRADKVAIYYQDQQITYGEVYRKVNQTGNALRDLGVRMEERVMLLLLDCPEFVYSFFGAMKIGAVPIPTNTLLKPQDYEYLLNDSRASTIIVSEPLLSQVEAVRGNLKYLKNTIVVGTPGPGHIGFDGFIDGASPELEPADTSKDDPAFWLYSSGTTGSPKGAVHLHHDMIHCSDLYARGVLGVNENDRSFSVAKLFFAYGLGNGLYFPFRVGASTVLFPARPEPGKIFEVIHRCRPTLFFSVPTAYAGMLQVEGAEAKYDTSSIRLCVSAGEALPKAIYERWVSRFGVEILDGIGTTEALHIFISNEKGRVKPGSSGRPVPGYEVKIVEENGGPVPRGEIGNMWVKGDSIAAYYWNKHDRTKQTMIGEWLNTGDKYYVDEDGCFWYAGRSDDMIKAGGIWVSPVEVESTLMEHPAVLECGVVGAEDSDGLTKPLAFVTLKQGYEPGPALVKEMQDFVKGKIAPYKYPRWVEFIPDLPKTATGKIQRYKLRQLVAERRAGPLGQTGS